MSKPPIFAAMLGLTMLLPVQVRAADDKAPKSDKPALFLRFAALDHLRADFRYLGEVVGQGEKAKQLDELIKSKLGEKGLEGIDPSKPFGAYGWVGAGGIDSKAVLLVPIAKQKAFVDLLSDTLDAKPEKGNDDVYTMNVDNVPFPIYFRFANGYAYVTGRDKEVLDKGKLLAPEAVLPGGQIGTASLTLNIDEIPDNLKENALGVIENQLASLKDKEMPTHSESQKQFRDAAVDEMSAQVKSLFKNGGATTLRLDLDRKEGNVSLAMRTVAKPGSSLANKIRDLAQLKSWTAALLHPDSGFRLELNGALPDNLRQMLAPALQDAEKQVLAKAKNEDEREVIKPLVEGVLPTLKAAELDTAIDLRGPSDKGLYTVIVGIKVKDGTKMERNFLKTAAKFPRRINLDAEKADQVNIHRIKLSKEDLDRNTRRVFGDNPIYVAFREDVLFVSLGEKGLDALKEALPITQRTGKVAGLQLNLQRLVPLFDNPKQAEIARKMFGSDTNSGRVGLSVEGGEALTLRLSLKAKLIDYLYRIDQSKKE